MKLTKIQNQPRVAEDSDPEKCRGERALLVKVLITILVCSVLLAGCVSDQKEGNVSVKPSLTTPTVSVPQTSVSNDSNPITVNLTFSKIPVVNETTAIRVVVNCIFDAPGTNVTITLPENVDLISGTTEKTLDLKANNSESLEAAIKFTKEGNYKITARARKVIDKENSWGSMDVLYLTIGNISSQITTPGPIESSPLNAGAKNQT